MAISNMTNQLRRAPARGNMLKIEIEVEIEVAIEIAIEFIGFLTRHGTRAT